MDRTRPGVMLCIAALSFSASAGAGPPAGAGTTIARAAPAAPRTPAAAPESRASAKARAAYGAAIALTQDGDTAGAIGRYSTVIALEPAFAAAHYERGLLKAETDDLNGAVIDFANAARQAPKGSWLGAQAMLERARCLYTQMDYPGAASGATDALSARPDFAEALALRAACRNALGQSFVALEDAQQAVALDEALAPAWLEQGRAFAALRKPDQAIDSFGRAVELLQVSDDRDNEVAALTARGEAHDSIGRVREALADYSAAIALNPSAYDALVGRALALSRLGRRDEAIADCQRAIAAAPARIRADHPASLLLARLQEFAGAAPASASAAER